MKFACVVNDSVFQFVEWLNAVVESRNPMIWLRVFVYDNIEDYQVSKKTTRKKKINKRNTCIHTNNHNSQKQQKECAKNPQFRSDLFSSVRCDPIHFPLIESSVCVDVLTREGHFFLAHPKGNAATTTHSNFVDPFSITNDKNSNINNNNNQKNDAGFEFLVYNDKGSLTHLYQNFGTPQQTQETTQSNGESNHNHNTNASSKFEWQKIEHDNSKFVKQFGLHNNNNNNNYNSNPKYFISLEVYKNGLHFNSIHLDKSNYVFGRDPRECDIVLAHESISRQHALLFFKNEIPFILDLGSTNKTFVDDVAIEPQKGLFVV